VYVYAGVEENRADITCLALFSYLIGTVVDVVAILEVV
jgi:hypothetical protein